MNQLFKNVKLIHKNYIFIQSLYSTNTNKHISLQNICNITKDNIYTSLSENLSYKINHHRTYKKHLQKLSEQTIKHTINRNNFHDLVEIPFTNNILRKQIENSIYQYDKKYSIFNYNINLVPLYKKNNSKCFVV
jgi:hypothetical protein